MLADSVRAGLAATRAAGLRAYAVALLGYVPIAVADAVGNAALAVVAAVAQTVVLFAVVRVLGAWRPEPLPAPPQVDDEGRRVLVASRTGPPVTDADRGVVRALRNAATMTLPALRLTGVFVLAFFAAMLTVIAITGGKVVEAGNDAAVLTVLPISALYSTFVAVAPQRIALEGETRVLVAVAHSVRVARAAYPLLLLMTVAEPLATLPVQLVGDEKTPLATVLPVLAGTVLVAALLQVVTTAIATEVYLRAPRLDLAVAE